MSSKQGAMAADPEESGIDEEEGAPEQTKRQAKKRESPFLEEDDDPPQKAEAAEDRDDDPEPETKPKRRPGAAPRQEAPPINITEIESQYRQFADHTAQVQAENKLRSLAEELVQTKMPEDLSESRLAEMSETERMNYMLHRQKTDMRREQIRREADHLRDETEHKRHLYNTQASQAIDLQRRAYSIWPELAASIWEDIRTKPIDSQLRWDTYQDAADKARGRVVNDQIWKKRMRDQNRGAAVAGRSGAGGGGEAIFDVSPEEKRRLVSMGLKGKSLERAMSRLRSPGGNR
jgi:hypothetical protein